MSAFSAAAAIIAQAISSAVIPPPSSTVSGARGREGELPARLSLLPALTICLLGDAASCSIVMSPFSLRSPSRRLLHRNPVYGRAMRHPTSQHLDTTEHEAPQT